MTRQLKLGAILYGAGGPGHHFNWLDPEIPVDASVDINWFIEYARAAEAAKFDLVFIVDSQFITPDSPPHYLNRLEPLTLLSALAVSTSHIGLVGTLTTSYNEPFHVARRLASLDLISGGRAGWNVVTTGDGGTAGNFGLDEHYDYATRYGRGEEFVKVVQALWDSYEDDAFVRNRETRQFLDPDKQHTLNHKGEYFSVVGPLNIVRSRQGQPVIFQAGDSDQGRDLGATIGEGIFTHAPSMQAGQAFYHDLKSRAADRGRDPDHVLIMPGISIFVGDTDEQAREIERHYHSVDNDFERQLGEFARTFGWHDFRQYDLDAPFPDVLRYAANSWETKARQITGMASERNLTLRETVLAVAGPKPSPFVGSAQTVADTIAQWFEARAFDGINYTVNHPEQFRRFTGEVLPLLRDRGLVRGEYEAETLRGNLGLPIPENRHTAARRAATDAARETVTA